MSINDRRREAVRSNRDGEETLMKVAHRNKLLGAWAAAHMGLTGEDAACYAMSIMEAGIDRTSDDVLVRNICNDLVARGFPIVEQDVRNQLEKFSAEAS